MGGQRFRVWFGDRAASLTELERIEEIEVTQEIDAFWEATVRMALCLDANGTWLDWPGDAASPFSRVRIELDIGDGRFVPLIDGPLTAIDAALDSQPGRSTASMVVRDDSAYLDRDEEESEDERITQRGPRVGDQGEKPQRDGQEKPQRDGQSGMDRDRGRE